MLPRAVLPRSGLVSRRRPVDLTKVVSAGVGAVRSLNVHEYLSMNILRNAGVPVPRTFVASSAEQVQSIYLREFDGQDVVLKAQVLAGGRGLGKFDNGFQGGVHICTTGAEAASLASKMLGRTLITKQTGATGKPCHQVMLGERVYMRREMYLSILMDRAAGGPLIVCSPRGGTSIEDVAASTPDAIFKVPVDIVEGIKESQAQEVARHLGFRGAVAKEAANVITRLYGLFISSDCTLLEVNPLAETPDGRVLVCDAKLNFDDNAVFRHKDVFALRDTSQEDQREVQASQYDLNYIGLSGNIGCMVNGAGLAMATMDIIKLHGGDPANFLDVGGGASALQVEKAFGILNGDPQVKAILVNIFGGIMRCDVIATGILAAAAKIGMKKPIVLRLQGTNVNEARQLIQSSGFRMIMTNDLDEAARKVVRVADIVRQAEEVMLDVKFELPL